MHIAFVIPNLGPGGAERVASLLCNYWAAQGHSVSLVTFEAADAEPFYDLHGAIALHQLDARGGPPGIFTRFVTNLYRVSRLRSLLRELCPDAVVAFTTDANVIGLCACLGLGVPVVISERNQPDRPGLGRTHKLARRLCYPLADAIVVQTEPIAAWARARFRVPVHVIPNPVLRGQDRINASAPGNGAREDGYRLLAVGRLTYQKGFDVLIRSFAALAAKHPDWQLAIYGEGPERSHLERLRTERGLEERISLPGVSTDIAASLQKASLFVLPSRFEGYPNVLLEALAAGLPVVATDGPGGTAEILGNGANGLLVPPDDVTAMTAALDTMMSAPDLRSQYVRGARHAVEHLDIGIIGKRWLDLLTEASR